MTICFGFLRFYKSLFLNRWLQFLDLYEGENLGKYVRFSMLVVVLLLALIMPVTSLLLGNAEEQPATSTPTTSRKELDIEGRLTQAEARVKQLEEELVRAKTEVGKLQIYLSDLLNQRMTTELKLAECQQRQQPR